MANQFGGAAGCIGDLFQIRCEPSVFLMLNEEAVSLALNHRKQVVQFVGQRKGYVPVGVGGTAWPGRFAAA